MAMRMYPLRPEERRSRTVRLRMTDAEAEQLTELARLRGWTLSQTMRCLVGREWEATHREQPKQQEQPGAQAARNPQVTKPQQQPRRKGRGR